MRDPYRPEPDDPRVARVQRVRMMTNTGRVVEIVDVIDVDSIEVEPEPVVDECPVGSVADVLSWVGESRDRARRALDIERGSRARKTLIARLEEMLA